MACAAAMGRDDVVSFCLRYHTYIQREGEKTHRADIQGG